METLYKLKNDNGEWSCGDIGVSKDQWLDLLNEKEAQSYLEALFCFLREPYHKGTCKDVAVKYGRPASHFNSKITHFSKWVQRRLNSFRIVGADGNETYWCITMQNGKETGSGFQWQLRDELADALQSLLMEHLIKEYSKKIPFNGFEEEYKWALLDETEGMEPLDIIESLKGQNLIDNARVDGVFKYLLAKKPEQLETVVNHLLDESKLIDKRIADFKSEMRVVCPNDWKNCANDERTASVILMCKYPEKYTVYKDEIYRLICHFFGFEKRNTGHKLAHFTEIINKFAVEFGYDIQQLMIPRIGIYRNKPQILAVQTFIWCMRKIMEESIKLSRRNYWLVGYTFDGEGSQLDRFIEEGIWESKHTDAGQKKFLEDVKRISLNDIIILKSTSTKGKNHDMPYMRVKAVGIVTSKVATYSVGNATVSKVSVDYINTDEKDFEGKVYGAFRKAIHLVPNKIKDVIDYVNALIYKEINKEVMPEMKYQKYIELLQNTHNLVLTGAPGTGKTYMAQAISREMGAETKFVQFHPSYDYTDFVEGLRPIEGHDGQITFERKDGVFKDFCRDAIRNMIDSEKSVESLSNEMSWQKRLESFVEDAIEKESTFNTVNGSEFVISETHAHTIVIRNDKNEKTGQVIVNADEILDLLSNEVPLTYVRDIRAYYNRKYATQADSYAFAIIKKVRETKQQITVTLSEKVDKKPFLFIIDEINRGETSKIFGELFYAIDPGYRGNKDHLVQTQYQNLVPETDVFARGFYVPDNVYILATTLDLQRQTETEIEMVNLQ